MDNKKKLEELEEKFEELHAEYKTAREDVLNLEGTKEYDEYHAIASDEARKEKFPEFYEMYKKEAELSEKLGALEREISELSKELSEGLTQAIAALEVRINAMQEQRKTLDEETVRIKAELGELKKTEAYLSGDKDAVKAVEDLESKLRKIRTEKGNLTKKINAFTKEIENIKQEQYDLQAAFVEDIIEEEEIITSSPEVISIEETVEETVEENSPLSSEEAELEQKQKEVKEILDKIQFYQEKMLGLVAEYRKIASEVKDLNNQIYNLKATEEFEKGNEETEKKVEALEAELRTKAIRRIEIGNGIREVREKMEALVEEKEALVEQYGEQVLADAKVTPSKAEQSKNVEIKKEVEQSKAVEAKNKEEQPKSAKSKKVTEQPKKQQEQSIFDNDPRFTTFPSGNEIRHSASKTQEELENTEKREAELQKKHDEKLKKEFVRLYSQAKRGALTELDYSKLTMIMGNPEYYEKLGITTGVVFNKARVILKAMALTAADTKKTATRSKKILGLAVEKASKANGYMPTGDVKEWRGLKKLAENPEQKIAGEELCKKIVELDCRWFNKEQLEVVDAAKRHLKKFEALRTATSAYKQVVDSRTKAKLSWIVEFEEEKKEVLPAAQAEQNGTLATNSLGLEALVNDIIDEDSIPPRVNSKGEPTQEK